jgi:hypothetical protein
VERTGSFREIGNIVDVLEGIVGHRMTTERRSSHRTQWAAQFAVASELCKLDYGVALTLGNHPAVDLLVVSPRNKTFQIDVKGLYRPNYWQIKKQNPRTDLFYVFALVPDNGPNRFFVMNQRTANRLIDEHWDNSPKHRSGIPWSGVEAHKDEWRVLPDFPQSRT